MRVKTKQNKTTTKALKKETEEHRRDKMSGCYPRKQGNKMK